MTRVERQVIGSRDVGDLTAWMAAAREHREAGRLREAARGFDEVAEAEPDGPLAPEALYEGGVVWDDLTDREAATARFERLVARHPDHALARDGTLRLMRLLAYTEHWARGAEVARLAQARHGRALRPDEVVIASALLALAALAAEDDAGAEAHIARGRSAVERHGLDGPGPLRLDLAPLYFALGELRRQRGERIVFSPMPPDFAQALERRCQLLLDAQAAYSDVMRAQDAHWSTLAGYRVGDLYVRLHADLLQMPSPPSARSDGDRALVEGALRLRYSVLLSTGVTMLDHTLAMARRTGERSTWVLRTEEARARVEEARRAEQAALDRLPYTRAQLQAALDTLRQRAVEPR